LCRQIHTEKENKDYFDGKFCKEEKYVLIGKVKEAIFGHKIMKSKIPKKIYQNL
jgi:hypothetical protein